MDAEATIREAVMERFRQLGYKFTAVVNLLTKLGPIIEGAVDSSGYVGAQWDMN